MISYQIINAPASLQIHFSGIILDSFFIVPYYLVYSTIPHACSGHAQPGDLLYTMRANGTTSDVYLFQCCNPEGTCYGTKQ